jgi:hypothetical protein
MSKLCPSKNLVKKMGGKNFKHMTTHGNLFAHLNQTMICSLVNVLCPHHQNRWKCQWALSSKWLFNFEHVVTIFFKTKAKKSTIVSFKCLIHQTHHMFMGVVMGMGCHKWQWHGVHSFEWSFITCYKLVFNFQLNFNLFLLNL